MNIKFHHFFYHHTFKLISRNKYERLVENREGVNIKNYDLSGFDKYKCIFFHIPKNGGISLSQSLFGNLGGGHKTVSTYLKIFSPSEFWSYYKFTVVRNPWSRIVSAYFFLKKGGISELDKKFCKNNLSSCRSFDDFLNNYINKPEILNYIHFRPQLDWISYKGNIYVDDWYYFEKLDDCIKELEKKLNKKITLNHLNKSSYNKTTKYTDYYKNENLKDIVGNIYLKDIETFNYSFNNID